MFILYFCFRSLNYYHHHLFHDLLSHLNLIHLIDFVLFHFFLFSFFISHPQETHQTLTMILHRNLLHFRYNYFYMTSSFFSSIDFKDSSLVYHHWLFLYLLLALSHFYSFYISIYTYKKIHVKRDKLGVFVLLKFRNSLFSCRLTFFRFPSI